MNEVCKNDEGDHHANSRSATSIISEPYFLGAMSALAYLITYHFDKAYLGYFGVDEAFIDVSLKKVLFSFVSLSAIFLAAWNIFSVIPSGFLLSAIKFFYIFMLEILVIFFILLTYFKAGVNWWLISMIIFILAVAVIHLTIIGWKRKSFSSHFQEVIAIDSRIESKLLRSKILDALDTKVVWLFFIVLIIAPLVGAAAGYREASQKRNFSTVQFEARKYLVVSEVGGGFISSEVENLGNDDDVYVLTGKFMIISGESLSKANFSSHIFKRGKKMVTSSKVRKTFAEFWRENFSDP